MGALPAYLDSNPADLGEAGSAHDRELMARISVRLFIGGALLTLLVMALPHGRIDALGLLAVCAGCLGGAGIMLVGAKRLPFWSFDVIAAYAGLLVTGARLFAESGGDRGTGIQALYLWIVLFVFYFLPRSHALLQLAWIGVLYAAVLAGDQPTRASITVWTVTIVGLLLAGLVIARMRDRTDDLVERLNQAARTDVLTGLDNRRAFDGHLERELARARRTHRRFSLLVGDLDRFKDINDRYGHPAGDAVLTQVGQVLRSAIRAIDTVARVGGDEFAILLAEGDEKHAQILVERLQQRLGDAFAGHDPAVTISIGVVVYPRDGETADGLRAAADKALYAVKQLDGGQPSVGEPGGGRRVHEPSPPVPHVSPELTALLTLVETIDARGLGSPEHSRRVAHLAGIVARQLGLPPAKVERIELAGSLHDIGTIGVPEAILRKRGPLTDDERDVVRRHPEIGAGILGAAPFVDIRDWVLHHHEQPDSGGYPSGLGGNEIPVEARILAVAEAYEAMTNDRSYRPSLGDGAARAELRRGSGTKFDGDVVEALLAAIEDDSAV